MNTYSLSGGVHEKEYSNRSLAAKCFLAANFILNQDVAPLLATGPYSYHHFYKKLE
jgi:hypothetical protein